MWKPEYASNRRKKYASDDKERERRKRQSRTPKENAEYMRVYYAKNKHRWKRSAQQQQIINARNRKKYAESEEYRNKCKAEVKDYRKRNPQAKFANDLKKYGLTPERYGELLASQHGSCAICKQKSSTKTRGFRMFIDHCHATGKVRGLLCGNCNFAIGHLQDSPELCEVAAEYLRAASWKL